MARIVELIETEITRGKGTHDDICRKVTQYFTKEGELLFEIDPVNKDEKWVHEVKLPKKQY